MVSIGEGTQSEPQLRTAWGIWGQNEARSIGVIGLVAKGRLEDIFEGLVAVVNRDALGHGPCRDGGLRMSRAVGCLCPRPTDLQASGRSREAVMSSPRVLHKTGGVIQASLEHDAGDLNLAYEVLTRRNL